MIISRNFFNLAEAIIEEWNLELQLLENVPREDTGCFGFCGTRQSLGIFTNVVFQMTDIHRFVDFQVTASENEIRAIEDQAENFLAFPNSLCWSPQGQNFLFFYPYVQVEEVS